MIRSKSNAALILLLAFAFRLLFIDFSLLNVPASEKTGRLHGQSLSALLKRKKTDESSVQGQHLQFEQMELCEEVSDQEGGLTKTHIPVLFSILFLLFRAPAVQSGIVSLFDSIKCRLFPKRYLSLSILRV